MTFVLAFVGLTSIIVSFPPHLPRDVVLRRTQPDLAFLGLYVLLDRACIYGIGFFCFCFAWDIPWKYDYGSYTSLFSGLDLSLFARLTEGTIDILFIVHNTI